MADTQYSVLSGIFKRLADIGAGHHAEVVAVVNPDGSPISGGGGGGGGGGGSVTDPGVSGAQAQAVQGVTGGVPMPVVPNVTRGGGNVDAGTQRVTLAQDGPGVTALNNIDADLGAQADAVATSDTGTFSLIALVKRGLTNWTTLLARIPALVNNRLPVNSSIPTSASGTILQLTTPNPGTGWMAFTAQACVALDIVNNTGTTIEYRRNATGTAMQIPSGAARMVIGITNANQIEVRRTDTSNTTVTLQAEAFTA